MSSKKGVNLSPDLDLEVLIGDRRSLALRKNLMLKIVSDRLFFYGSPANQAARISRRKRQI
jgi:hypothetical protein